MKRLRVQAVAAVLIFGGAGLAGPAYAEKAVPIGDGMQVTLEYTLTLPDKTVADTTVGEKPFSYTQGNHEIIPGLEKALAGLKAGDKKRILVPAAEAYGLYDEKKKATVPKKNVPPDVQVGMKLFAQTGQEVRVLEIKDDAVVVDVNHPLAGKDLTFDVNIIKVEPPPKPAKDK